MGKWIQTAGKWFGDASDKGIQTGEDAKYTKKERLLLQREAIKLDKMFGGKKNYELKTISNEEGTTNWFIKYQNG